MRLMIVLPDTKPLHFATVYRTSKISKYGDLTMKNNYDPVVDVLRIIFSNTAIEERDEEKPGMILDYDIKGNMFVRH